MPIEWRDILSYVLWIFIALSWLMHIRLKRLYKQRYYLKDKHIEALKKQIASKKRAPGAFNKQAYEQFEDLINSGRIQTLEKADDEWPEILEDPNNERR